MRRRSSSTCSCGISTVKGRTSVAVPTVVLMTTPFHGATPKADSRFVREPRGLLSGGEQFPFMEFASVGRSESRLSEGCARVPPPNAGRPRDRRAPPIVFEARDGHPGNALQSPVRNAVPEPCPGPYTRYLTRR